MNQAIHQLKRSEIAGARFSIIIPTWNNLELLQLCVASIKKNSRYQHQVIVHINEGVDGTLDWVKAQPDLDYSYSAENIGVCYALNISRPLMSTPYLVYLNDDMYVCPGWDEALWDEIQKLDHNYFFLSGTAIEARPQSNCSIRGDFGTDPTSFREKELLGKYADIPMGDWQGSTWPPNVVHRDIWDLAGGYSIEFSPGMYSDPDFSMKLWQIGVRLFKGVSSSRVYHFGSKTTKKLKKSRGYYRFISKWGITSSTFGRYYLHRGEPFAGPLKEPVIGMGVRLKNLYKRLLVAFYIQS